MARNKRGRKRNQSTTSTASGNTSVQNASADDGTSELSEEIRLKDFEIKFQKLIDEIDSTVNRRIQAINWQFNVAINQIPPEILHSKIKWNTEEASKKDNEATSRRPLLRSSTVSSANGDVNRRQLRSTSLDNVAIKQIPPEVLQSKIKWNTEEALKKDEATSRCLRLRSSTVSSENGDVNRRQLRSTSVDKPPNIIPTVIKNRYKTPASNIKSSIPCVITTKVSGHGPVCMARYPQTGEMAVSLAGSPLMVTPVIQNYRANANVVLPNGNVMSILPEHGLQPNYMPGLDEETRKELQALNDNIKAFINMTGGKL